MKLIFCPECSDVVRLVDYSRQCECGKSTGRYLDEVNAITTGLAIPLGIANPSLLEALNNRPEEGLGSRFEAFVIPRKCPTIKQE